MIIHTVREREDENKHIAIPKENEKTHNREEGKGGGKETDSAPTHTKREGG